MGRAAQARRIAAAAAFGGTGLGMIGAAGFGVLVAEAKLARRWIGEPFGKTAPDATGLYGSGEGTPVEMAMLGDSSAAGLGVERAEQAPGAVIAAGLAAMTGRPVRLRVQAFVGAQTSDLDAQIAELFGDDGSPPRLDLAVVMVGANDVTHRVRPAVSVRHLDSAVRTLGVMGATVVVGTCPDLGTIEPIAQPLRLVARHWSRQLAAAQTIAVVEAGGRTVSLGDILREEFHARPSEMFSSDRFHPSAAGYARAASALLSSCAAALQAWPEGTEEPRPDLRAGEGVDDVAHAAARAVSAAGTEVVGAELGGSERGPRGRWALLLRRNPTTTVPDEGRQEHAAAPPADARPEDPDVTGARLRGLKPLHGGDDAPVVGLGADRLTERGGRGGVAGVPQERQNC